MSIYHHNLLNPSPAHSKLAVATCSCVSVEMRFLCEVFTTISYSIFITISPSYTTFLSLLLWDFHYRCIIFKISTDDRTQQLKQFLDRPIDVRNYHNLRLTLNISQRLEHSGRNLQDMGSNPTTTRVCRIFFTRQTSLAQTHKVVKLNLACVLHYHVNN